VTGNSTLRILVVDDNRDGADSMSMLLGSMGNDTRTAYDGEEAMAMAFDFSPDIILLDIGLPKLDGYETCRRIREQPWGKGIVIIACTGWEQDEDTDRSDEVGFDLRLVKPLEPATLMKLLTELEAAKARCQSWRRLGRKDGAALANAFGVDIVA
jgi:CheY-like chemotaxis protein